MRVLIDISAEATGAAAQFEHQPIVTSAGTYFDDIRAALDKAYAEACVWLDAQRPRTESAR